MVFDGRKKTVMFMSRSGQAVTSKTGGEKTRDNVRSQGISTQIRQRKILADPRKLIRSYYKAIRPILFFYIHKGKIKLTVIARGGTEAVIANFCPVEFFGEGCLASQPLRMASSTT